MNTYNVNLGIDPQVVAIVNEMKTLVEGADVSDVLRAAVRHFSEVAAKYEQEVYIREQLELANPTSE